ncbi:unnamed protein product [Nippostrongylus brasiliensis]|uniref:Uncharacterized protein n=1 Tax=Nippostrongylus brasiliensis TaxID=27835 RepID=A0A0N4Y0D3_NIPBR|nr:unnamed protein product [Nippostrongylus brasiliensis]
MMEGGVESDKRHRIRLYQNKPRERIVSPSTKSSWVYETQRSTEHQKVFGNDWRDIPHDVFDSAVLISADLLKHQAPKLRNSVL